jgi:hypothetical protein
MLSYQGMSYSLCKARVLNHQLWGYQAQREADALEARRRQSQKVLEAAQRQKELEEERKRAAEARAREREERLAQEATAKLDAMRAQWRESAALQQVNLTPSMDLLNLSEGNISSMYVSAVEL